MRLTFIFIFVLINPFIPKFCTPIVTLTAGIVFSFHVCIYFVVLFPLFQISIGNLYLIFLHQTSAVRLREITESTLENLNLPKFEKFLTMGVQLKGLTV